MKGNIISKELNTGDGKNRFKYQTFNERVKSIKIDILHDDKSSQEREVLSSFFQESLESWKELNLTRHFAIFVREVSRYCQSLPQLLYHKEKIVEILERNLKVEESLALEPLLNLVTELARDLEAEFYLYFERIFSCIIPLTKHQDVKILECTFSCIAYLFKYLKKQIIDDLCPTYRLIAPLIGKEFQKPYIQRFAAESFAFLLHKARGNKLTEIINYIIDSNYKSPSEIYCRGLSTLFSEAAKSSENRLHSRGSILLKELLYVSYSKFEKDSEIESNSCYLILKETTIALLHYIKCENFVPVLNLYLEEIENESNKAISETSMLKIGLNMSLIYICLTVRKGDRVNDFKRVFRMAQNIAPHILVPSSHGLSFLRRQFFKMCTSLFISAKLDDILVDGKVILDKIFEYNDVDTVLSFLLGLSNLKWKDYTKIMLPYIIRYFTTHWATNNTKLILFCAHLFITDTVSVSSGTVSSYITKNGLIKFPNMQKKSEGSGSTAHKNVTDGLIGIIKQDYDWFSDAQKLSLAYLNKESSCNSEISLISAALTIIPHLLAQSDSVIVSLSSLIMSLSCCLRSSKGQISSFTRRPFVDGSPLFLIQNLLGQAIETITIFVQKNCESDEIEFMSELWSLTTDELLVQYGMNEMILKGVAGYMEYMKSCSKHNGLFNTNSLEKIYPYLKSNFSSYKHRRRLYSFTILRLFDQFHLYSEERFKNDEELCEIFALVKC